MLGSSSLVPHSSASILSHQEQPIFYILPYGLNDQLVSHPFGLKLGSPPPQPTYKPTFSYSSAIYNPVSASFP